MSVVSVSPWRGIAEHLTQVADSLEASSASLVEARTLSGRVRHSSGGYDAPSYLKFRSDADRARWRELLDAGGTERGVAHAGARMLERQLRTIDLPQGDLGMPAAMVRDISAAVGYAENINSARGGWVDGIERMRAEPDATHGLRGRPSIDFANSSSLQYEWVTSGSDHAIRSVRNLARVASGLAEPADTSAIVRLHTDRGAQLAREDALTPLRSGDQLQGIDSALDLRTRATPMVQDILAASPNPASTLTTATRDSLLETAARHLDDANADDSATAASALDAIRDVAALAHHSKEFTDVLGPALVSAERRTIDGILRTSLPESKPYFNDGRDMFGIEPIADVQGLRADAGAHVQEARDAVARLQRGVPELQQSIRADAPPLASLSFEDEFATRLEASRSAVALEA